MPGCGALLTGRGVALREIEEIASGEAGRILPTDLQT